MSSDKDDTNPSDEGDPDLSDDPPEVHEQRMQELEKEQDDLKQKIKEIEQTKTKARGSLTVVQFNTTPTSPTIT